MRRLVALAAIMALLSGEAYAAYDGAPPLIVARGGTGTVTNTNHGVLLGQGTSAIVAVAPGATSGVPLIAQGAAADPAYGTAVVAGGGTGAVTLTNHGLLVGQGTSALVALAPAADSIPLWQTSSADPTVTAIGICTGAGKALSYDTATHTFGCNTITAGVAPTLVSYTSTLPMTMGSTNFETVVSNMGTPAAGVYNLPTASSNLRKCLKDGTTNFATNNATVKATGTIDAVAGATGIVMNQSKQELCFISDGTNWYIE
jgi:uncharacterized membrane protein